ncbi:N-lysine methyltransferase KMT5A-A-like [Brachionichthys hirsutus]|uniref:N-lysine methyltransferase KMT5A-A-like n=1 Tax=Brachionichthys hirsutus TaxID=412623 RepID=UPI0036050DD8
MAKAVLVFIYFYVNKGKKNVPRTDTSTGECSATSRKETKENDPTAPKVMFVLRLVNNFLQPANARHRSKPRSPLSDSSGTLTQGGNDSDAINPDTPKMKEVIPTEINPESCDPGEKKPEPPHHSHAIREQEDDQLGQRETATHTNSRPEPVSKASAKTRSRSNCKLNAKNTGQKASQNKVTDYYPIRRSNRKTKSELKNEEYRRIDDVMKSGVEEGMQIKHIEGKGRGIFAVSGFKKGAFVVEYHGDLLEPDEAKTREARYAEEPQTGCYMYYFHYQSKAYCVDATKETNRLGRLINHSKAGNCHTRLHPIDGTPRLILVASRDIKRGEELSYDYGDRSKASVMAHPWLKC